MADGFSKPRVNVEAKMAGLDVSYTLEFIKA
jgi:hypothetical protein